MFELMEVDGVPAGELATPEKLDRQMQQLMGMQRQIMSALLAQQQEISKLTAALATVRISRTQELAMREAITARAAMLARTEDMPSSERRIAGAIRKTLRETTGARAIGDLQAAQFDRAMEMVGSWHMTGALRKIRREVQQHEKVEI
ncbi:MAG: hypothetical protein ACI4O8_08200 [Aristaeellaceae bacterium]